MKRICVCRVSANVCAGKNVIVLAAAANVGNLGIMLCYGKHQQRFLLKQQTQKRERKEKSERRPHQAHR